ncbi:hypothetical protein GCM10009780_17870 [Actinomadura alba]
MWLPPQGSNLRDSDSMMMVPADVTPLGRPNTRFGAVLRPDAGCTESDVVSAKIADYVTRDALGGGLTWDPPPPPHVVGGNHAPVPAGLPPRAHDMNPRLDPERQGTANASFTHTPK